jgi:squalene-hopene/tetraprenyl-beta-curcumene cyclase
MVFIAAYVPRMKPACLFLFAAALACAADAPKPKPRPAFQYETEGVQISIPTADEPRVTAFGPDTIKAASKYLEGGAISWVREKNCINCHTTGPYMTERPALTPLLGKPNEEILADFIDSVPPKVAPVKEAEKDGLKYHPRSYMSVWCSLGLAEWDKHVTGKLSEATDRSLRDMFEHQSADGSFVSYGEVEIPHITTDFELTLQAARAVTAAPGWLAKLKDADLLARMEKMKTWLRGAKPKNDFDRVLKLQLASYMPELVPQAERDAALALLFSKQHTDGGWSTRDMSALSDWHFKMSDTVVKLITSLPDADKPESDAYMTALAIVLMRQNNIPASDERIQRGIAWLKREQRVSGRWWMHSLYRGNYHYITYIATCQALKALAMCGEIQ